MGRGVTRSFSGLRCQYDTDEERIDAIPARRVDDLSLLRGRAGGDCVEADEGVEGRVVDGVRAAVGGGMISRTARAIDVALALAFRHVRQAECRRHCFCELGGFCHARCCRCGQLTDQPSPSIHRARTRDAIGRWER